VSQTPFRYLTVSRDWGPSEFREKGSRFISFLFPCATAGEAGERIASLRGRFNDATHVCFAWRLGEGVEREHRYSDDGEPGGTAGMPIYNEIRSVDYLNVGVAVVRYYGGVKLGTGGLARAYGKGARLVLESARPEECRLSTEAMLTFPFSLTGEMMQVVRRQGLEVTEQTHSEAGTCLRVNVPLEVLEGTRHMVREAGGGRARFYCQEDSQLPEKE